MRDDNDFGFGQVDWERTNSDNVKLVESEYRERLTGAIAAWNDLDSKARFLFTGLIGLVTALLGWVFSQSQNIELDYKIGIYTLVVVFIVSSMLVAKSITPRPYAYLGVTPKDLNVSRWWPLLKGDRSTYSRFLGMKIKEYSRAIVEAERSNDLKALWMARAIRVIISAFPLAAVGIIFASVRW
jgi:hypothetical protein